VEGNGHSLFEVANRHSPEGVEGHRITLNLDSLCLGLVSNWVLAKYKAGTLPPELTCSMYPFLKYMLSSLTQQDTKTFILHKICCFHGQKSVYKRKFQAVSWDLSTCDCQCIQLCHLPFNEGSPTSLEMHVLQVQNRNVTVKTTE
jgi:hypothetical protein